MSESQSKAKSKTRGADRARQSAAEREGVSGIQAATGGGGAPLGPFYSGGPALLLGSPLQAKVEVGQPHDPYEREAQAVADRVAGGGTVAPSLISPLSPGGLARAKSPAEKQPKKQPVQKAAEKPEQKVQDKKPVQKAAAPKPEEKPVQSQAQENKKPDDKPVQKAETQKPAEKKPETKPVQKAAEKPEQKVQDKKPVQKAAAPKPEEKPVQSQAQENKKPDDKPAQKAESKAVQRQPDDEPHQDLEEQTLQTEPAGGGSEGTDSMAATAEQAIGSKGPGAPLNSSTRDSLESRLGADFGQVRVHEDSASREAAQSLNARAFTHQNDIWLGRGASQHDLHLMAHEATHVLQQSGQTHGMFIQREPKSPAAAVTSTPEEAKRSLETLNLPQVKARHKPVYDAWASAGNLKRVKGYDRGEPDQKDSVWIPSVNVAPDALKRLDLDQSFSGKKVIEVPKGKKREGTYQELLRLIKVPDWDRKGKVYSFSLEVDHIVELQAAGWGELGAANTIKNMELLDKSSNASAGASMSSAIKKNVRKYLQSMGQKAEDADKFLKDNDIPFNKVEVASIGKSEGASSHWTKEEIESGNQLKDAKPIKNLGQAGTATSFALVSPTGGFVLAEYPHGTDELAIKITSKIDQKRVAGLKITAIQLNEGYALAKADAPIGTVQAEWDLPAGVEVKSKLASLSLLKSAAGQYAGYIGPLPALETDVTGGSPLRFEEVKFEAGMISAKGNLTSTIPLLAKVPIESRLKGGAIEFAYIYRPGDLTLPVPGLAIDDSSIGIFFGTEGLGVEGSIALSVQNLGSGELAARIDSSMNFEASGNFNFDSKLFDKAEIDIWYREQAIGGKGILAIEKPDKVRGIRSARIEAAFNKGKFEANGNVKPSIPGVQEAALSVEYSEEAGLTIGGSLQLADNIPGISSGSVDAKVQKKPGEDRWIVNAKGQAVPKIPGISTSLTVSYDDGIFDVSGTAAYEKGMLKGSVLVGATNRAVDETGKPGGEATKKLTAYGGGSVTVKIAPWLQGTVGLKLLPNGELEVSGEIALPATLDIFPEKKLDKNIFTIGIDIPIVGVAVAGQRIGIFANISGGLDLSAGIGPGQLQELGLKITYNPAHEEQTHVSGGAKLHIPAHAGLRLFVRGGIGAGIPIVSAQAGLEIGGQLGLEGAVDAGVQVDWTPAKGLQIDAAGEIYVEPKLKFDITGFVLVEADLWLKTIELYSKKWQLAGFEYGSGLRFGVKFPIHYQEGKPFDISLSDVQFQIPDIKPKEILSDLIKKI